MNLSIFGGAARQLISMGRGIVELYRNAEKAGVDPKVVAEKVLAATDNAAAVWTEDSKGSNLNRRMLAPMVAYMWFFLILLSAALHIFGDTGSSEFVGGYVSEVQPLVVLVYGVYFSGHYGKQIIEAFGKKAASQK